MGSHGLPPWKRVPKTPLAEVATSALRMLGLTQDPYAEDWALQRMEDTEKADSIYYDAMRQDTNLVGLSADAAAGRALWPHGE